jgi:hypothetical protein
MLPHAYLHPLPMGLVPAVVSPRSSMLDNLCIHQKFITTLLLPLVLEGVPAGMVNPLAIWRR